MTETREGKIRRNRRWLRRQRRREKVSLGAIRRARARRRELYAELREVNEEIAVRRDLGCEVPPEIYARRRDLRARVLAKDHFIDERLDTLRDARARIARTRKRLARLRRQGAPGRVITRSEWGAAAPRGSYAAQTALSAGVLHHTAYPALPASASIAQEAARMREIQRGHFARGFTDIGYCRVVFPSGRIYEGRPPQYVGAHTLNYNTGYAGWSIDGNYESDAPTAAALAAAKAIRADLGLTNKHLYGHFELGSTLCPGANLKPRLRDGSI